MQGHPSGHRLRDIRFGDARRNLFHPEPTAKAHAAGKTDWLDDLILSSRTGEATLPHRSCEALVEKRDQP
jgi:hypothetical protein